MAVVLDWPACLLGFEALKFFLEVTGVPQALPNLQPGLQALHPVHIIDDPLLLVAKHLQDLRSFTVL